MLIFFNSRRWFPWEIIDGYGGFGIQSLQVTGNNQTVDLDKNTAFPVVADPSVWQITKCVGSIAWVVGTTIFAATKLVKIKKYVKELGGIKNTAQLLIGATSVTEKSTAVAKTLLTLAATISGIDSVYKNCKLGSAINIIKKRLGIWYE